MNNKQIFVLRILLLGFFFMGCYVSSALAQASQGDACTVTDKVITTAQPGLPSLYCDGANLQYFFVSTPNSALACGATTEGAIRYESVAKNIEVCNGTSWEKIIVSACDNTPAFLAFPSLTSQATSTLVTSSILAVTGMDTGCTTSVDVSGTGGSPQYRTCSDSGCSTELQTWTSANNTLDIQGNYIQLRATTSGSSNTSFTITLDTGSVSSDWIITTGLTDCSPIGTVCADGTVYAGLYAGSTPFFVTRCDAGQTWGGSSCDGTASWFTWNQGHTSDYVTVGTTTAADGQSNTSTLIVTDSNSLIAGTQLHNAAQFCADLVLHGHSDWYLPARDELGIMFDNRTAIGTFSADYFWSSTEDSNSDAWITNFTNSFEYAWDKKNAKLVRCARR